MPASPARPSRLVIPVAIAALLAAAAPALGQTDYYWNAPAGGTGAWNTTDPSWSTTAAGPADYTWASSGGERANFGNAAGTVTVAAGGVTAYGLNFTATNYTVAGGTLTLAGTGGPIDTAAGVAATVSAPIAGAAGLTKTGSGTLALVGTSSYTGVTTVSSGVLSVTAAGALGATGAGNNTTVTSGAAIRVSGAINVPEAITLNGTGVAGDGALRKTGSNTTTWSGAVTLGSATRLNSDAGTLTVTGGVSGTGQALTVGGAGNTTLNGVISTGAGGTVTKDGAGVLTLGSGSNTFAAVDTTSVVITVTGGELVHNGESSGTAGAVSATGSIPSAATPSYVLLNGGTFTSTRAGVGVTFLATNKGVTLGDNGGTLRVTDTTAGDLNIYQGVIAGTGGLTYAGPGILSLTNDQTYQGPTAITGGTLRTRTTNGASNWLPDRTDLTVTGPGVWDLAGFNETIGSLAGTGTVVANATGGTLTVGGPAANPNNNSTVFSGNITSTAGGNTTLALVKRGTGTLTLGGNNLYTGATTISAGAIAVRSNTALGGTGTGTTVASGAALVIDGSGLSVAEPLTLSGTGVSNGGAVRNLAGDNTLSGAVTLNAATRVSSDGGTLAFTGGVTGTNRNLTVGGAGNTTLGGIVATGTGTLTKDGTGTLALGADNTYTGGTSVTGGTLLALNASGSATGGGAVSVTGTGVPGGGTLGGTGRVAGAVSVGGGGVLRGGDAGGVGALTIGGGLTLNAGAVTAYRVTGGAPSTGANGSSSSGGVTNPDSNNFVLVTGGGLVFNPADAPSLRFVIDGTGAPFTLNQPYSYRVGQVSVAAGTPQDLSGVVLAGDDVQGLFSTVGFAATNFSLVGDAGGFLYVGFTPVPEPAAVLGVAAAALGLGGLVRRRLRRPSPETPVV